MKRVSGIAMAVWALWSSAAVGQSMPKPAAAADRSDTPTVVRRFVAPGVNEAIAYAELLDLKHAASAASVVDAVVDLVPLFGQSTGLQPMPMGEIRGQGFLFRFPHEKAVGAMVEDSGSIQGSTGRHACRVVMDPSKGKPEPSAFLVLTRWCMHAIALANIDGSVFGAR
jgi:hypothetical protein